MTEKIIDKIKNLLKLSEGNENPNEAAAAAAAAQKLITRYNISRGVAESIGGLNSNYRNKFTHKSIAVNKVWEASLSEEISESSEVFVLGITNGGKISEIKIFGKPEDVEVFASMFVFLREEILRILSKKYLSVLDRDEKWQNAFCFGAASAIGERLKQEKEKSVVEIFNLLRLSSEEKGISLVHVANAIQKMNQTKIEIEKFVEEEYETSEFVDSENLTIKEASQKGFEEGSRMNLRRELKKEKRNEI